MVYKENVHRKSLKLWLQPGQTKKKRHFIRRSTTAAVYNPSLNYGIFLLNKNNLNWPSKSPLISNNMNYHPSFALHLQAKIWGENDFENMIPTDLKQYTLVTVKIICNSTSSNMKQMSHSSFSKRKKSRNFYYAPIIKTSPLLIVL